MTTAIVDQPSPTATDRRPTWGIVMSYVEQLRRDNAPVSLGVAADVISLVLLDMRDRDAVGQQRYGVRLTSGNGRDHLVDAFQECLDASVYLAAALDEHGVGPSSALTEDDFPDRNKRWYLHDVQQLCCSQIRTAIHLRSLIEERNGL